MSVFSALRREHLADLAEDRPPMKAASPRPAAEPTLRERTPKALAIDPGVALDGRIQDCDLIRVGGDVRGEIVDSQSLAIVEAGRFDGKAEVLECEVSGEFIGTLVVRGRLTIRASGRVSGTIQYGHIEIERGGQLRGSISLCDAEPDLPGGADEPPFARAEDRGKSVDHLARDASPIVGRVAGKAIEEHATAGRKVHGIVGRQLLSRSPDDSRDRIAGVSEPER